MSKNQSDVIDLSKLFATFWDRKKTIIFTTLLFSALGGAYALFAPAVYNANASVQVETKYRGGALKELSTIFEQESSAAAEIGVIKSRAILTHVVDELNLSTQVTQKYAIPFLSKGLEKLAGEKPILRISHFVPKTQALTKIVLEIGLAPETYRLYNENEQLLLQGKVGESYDTEQFSIKVLELEGAAGKKFIVEKLDELKVIGDLQKQLSAEEQGKLTGMILLSLKGENKEYIFNVLRAITESYIRHSSARNSAEAEKSLAFLKNQLPEVKARLAESENALNQYRQKTTALDLGLEAKSMLETMVQLEESLNELAIKESEVSQRFKPSHPAYAALLQQRAALMKEKARLTKEMGELPEKQKEVVRLTRNFESDQQIYVQLQNKIQELDVIRAGAVSNVRLLDKAEVLPDPIAPRKLLILVFATLIGAMLGCAIVILSSLRNKGVKVTDEISDIGLNVYASIPYTKQQHNLSRAGKNKASASLLVERFPNDLSMEELRGLRTDMSYMLKEAENNSIMLCGVTANVGRTFISANLAHLIAQTQQRVLVIDADLRRGKLHTVFGKNNQQGLSNVLNQNTNAASAIQSVNSHLSLLTRGAEVNNASELLSSAQFRQLLDWASEHYDVVIVSAPPLLAVTDAAVIAQQVGTALLIGRFEQTTVKEIEICRQRFVYSGSEVKGIIFNAVKLQSSTKDDYFHQRYA